MRFRMRSIKDKVKQADREKVLSGVNELILVLYALFLAEAFLRTTTFRILWPEHFHDILSGSMVVLVIIKNTIEKPDGPADRLTTAILTACFVAARIYSGYAVLGDIVLLILALKRISMKQILKVFLATISCLLLITVAASQNGLTENLVYLTGEGKVRNSFGVCYPTDFAAYFFWLSLAWIYFRNEKLRLIEIAGIALAGIGVLKLCVARTSALCLFGIAFFSLVLKIGQCCRKKGIGGKRSVPKWIRMLPTLAIPGCAAFVILTSYVYNPESGWMQKLNTVLSSRLSLGRTAFETYDVKWLGQYVAMRGNGGSSVPWRLGTYFFLDSAWMSVLMCYGILIFFCILLLYWFCACRAAEEKKYFIVLVFVMIAVNAISEHHMTEICYNPFLFVLLAGGLPKDKYEDIDCKEKDAA